jgi:hypothetical protein
MKKIIIWLISFAAWLSIFYMWFTHASSILEDVTNPACEKWYLNCDQSTVAWLVDSSISISLFGGWWVTTKGPFIVRLTVFLMRMTALLAVTSLIIAWLTYIMAQWEEKEEKSILDWVKRIVLWLLLMSAATTIITLIISIFSNSSVWGLF